MTSPTQTLPRSGTRRPPGVLRLALAKPLGLVAAVVLAIIVLASVFAPLLAPHDPIAQNLAIVKQGPSPAHPLGTDSLGRDILSRLLYGGRDSLTGVLQAVIAMLVIAVPLGVIAGYRGGSADRIILRIVDILMSIPSMIITLAVLAIFSNSMFVAMLSVGVLASGAFIRIIRSAVVGVRGELYIGAARVAGLGELPIMVRHVLPQTRGLLLVQVSLFSASVLGIQTGLVFLAFGPPPPAPTWGGMVAEAASLIQSDPWLLVPSGGIIAVTTLALGLLGDALRDANQQRFTLSVLRRGAPPSRKPPAPQTSAAEMTPGNPDALLSVRGLAIAFGRPGSETTVVENVDFDIMPGEVVGLVGESGSGKTVTALALIGLLDAGGRVSGGSARFRGEELVGASARTYRAVRGSEIAMISQDPLVALDPSFRVGSQIADVVRLHERCSRADARRRVDELLDAVRLPRDTARRYPHEVSGGMAQRAAIAIALAGHPKLLIADEPTTALDVTVQAEILELLRRIQADTGMAVLLVSHDWGVIADLCSRAVVMYAGQVVERASVAETFSSPRHPYTLGLLRSNPHGVEPGQPLPTIGGSVPPPRAWPEGCHFAARCPLTTAECEAAPVPMLTLGADRASRCIHIDQLVSEAAR